MRAWSVKKEEEDDDYVLITIILHISEQYVLSLYELVRMKK